MRSSNPVLQPGSFNKIRTATGSSGAQERMTIAGTANKGFILFALMMCTFMYTWSQTTSALQEQLMPSNFSGFVMGGAIAGFILALVTMFKPNIAHITVPLYALCQGLFLGGISAMYEFQFQGIVFQAVGITMLTFFMVLLSYRWGLIRATNGFKKGIFVATGAIALMYISSFVLSFFGVSIPYIHGNGPIGIAVSVVICIVAALNLILDFDFIENSANQGAPKQMEWLGAFGLMVTLIWLYLEVLRLLSKLRSRD